MADFFIKGSILKVGKAEPSGSCQSSFAPDILAVTCAWNIFLKSPIVLFLTSFSSELKQDCSWSTTENSPVYLPLQIYLLFHFYLITKLYCLHAKWSKLDREDKYCVILLLSVQSLSRVRHFATPWIAACQASCPSPTPGIYTNPCTWSRWCHPTIWSSVVPFSSCPQSFPASVSFPVSQLFSWGGQSIGVSASTSVLPMNTQDWYLLGWTAWISLQSKGLSRVFSNTTVQKHQISGRGFVHSPTFTSVHDYWKNHRLD